jgi:hypothetical protein
MHFTLEAWSSICEGSAFLQKTWKHSGPEMQPDAGCMVHHLQYMARKMDITGPGNDFT